VRDSSDTLARGDLDRGGDDRVPDPLGGLGARAGDGGHAGIVPVRSYLLRKYVRTY
jgi:hypothetical protein